MGKNIVHYIAAFILISISSESLAQKNDHRLTYLIRSVQKQYAPDKRLAVFQITWRNTKTGLVLNGEVDDPRAKKAVIKKIKNKSKCDIIDSIKVLPETNLGSWTNGIVIQCVTDVLGGPDKNNELVTQALMGMAVKLLKRSGGYFYAQMPDRYLGWIDTASVYTTDKSGLSDWNRSDKIIVTSLSGIIYQQPDTTSIIMSEVVQGCLFKFISNKNGWVSVEYADGRKGSIPASFVCDYNEWKNSRVLSGENLEKTARSFLGITYLWGGMSVRGMDCSGFVKTVYRLNGKELLRDASQQARQGKHIEPDGKLLDMKKGDLLFFGIKAAANRAEHITHVAMYLENGLFIHSSHNVHYSSFDPASKYYDEALLKKFVRARRLF
jgi:gamma-D-glutamyl-L-lysine dipeptidyl-peptidase